jgi:hypothetical protein
MVLATVLNGVDRLQWAEVLRSDLVKGSPTQAYHGGGRTFHSAPDMAEPDAYTE